MGSSCSCLEGALLRQGAGVACPNHRFSPAIAFPQEQNHPPTATTSHSLHRTVLHLQRPTASVTVHRTTTYLSFCQLVN